MFFDVIDINRFYTNNSFLFSVVLLGIIWKCVRILCVTTVIRGESNIYGIFCKSMQNN